MTKSATMKVGAVFTDYDGTVAPLGVPRDESRMFREVELELRALVRTVPVCLVTSKDFGFIHPRSRFASGWACVSGLDVRLADGRGTLERRLRDLTPALDLAAAAEKLGTVTEVKRGPGGEVLAVAIDWTGVSEAGGYVLRGLKPLAGGGLWVSHDGETTFADIFGAPPDKGKATRVLRKLLRAGGCVMFIGDSAFDNSAFRAAEISVGVEHGQQMERLECRFTVEQSRLAEFLRSLSGRGMEFSPAIPGLRRREE